MKTNLSVEMIKIFVTSSAARQVKVITDNDYTLEGMSLRVKISGKECDGFTYQIGFTPKDKDDLIIPWKVDGMTGFLLMDPFTAFYTQDSTLDFVQNGDEEGFLVMNHQQKKHRGKFYKDESMLPPWKGQ